MDTGEQEGKLSTVTTTSATRATASTRPRKLTLTFLLRPLSLDSLVCMDGYKFIR